MLSVLCTLLLCNFISIRFPKKKQQAMENEKKKFSYFICHKIVLCHENKIDFMSESEEIGEKINSITTFSTSEKFD